MKRQLHKFFRRLRKDKRLQILTASGVCMVAVIIAVVVGTVISTKNRQDAQKQQALVNHDETQQSGENLEQMQPLTTEEQTTTETAEASEEVTETEEKTTQKATKAPTEAQTNEQAAETLANGVVGTSSKGYTIELRNGVTYVNGILIANKSYALPSSFGPGGLSGQVQQSFNVMQSAAAAEGLNIYISSGYRSYSRQKTIYNNYVNKDGKAMADTYSARAGHSEHQSGLCFDLNSIDDSFALTAESDWVKANAHQYGFIIRYPKGKESITGYQYESWHLRYLGVELATDVYESGLCLEEYLGITSQYE